MIQLPLALAPWKKISPMLHAMLPVVLGRTTLDRRQSISCCTSLAWPGARHRTVGLVTHGGHRWSPVLPRKGPWSGPNSVI